MSKDVQEEFESEVQILNNFWTHTQMSKKGLEPNIQIFTSFKYTDIHKWFWSNVVLQMWMALWCYMLAGLELTEWKFCPTLLAVRVITHTLHVYSFSPFPLLLWQTNLCWLMRNTSLQVFSLLWNIRDFSGSDGFNLLYSMNPLARTSM